MSEQPCPPPQTPVKIDLRKVNTPERLERLRLAREVRAKNRLAQEEKRMELAKQMILASAGVPEKKTKTSPDEKKVKWEARKAEILEEFSRKFAEANAEAALKKKEPVPEPSESGFSDMEEPPAKRQKRSSKSKKSSKGAAAPVKSKSAKKSSSTTASNAYERGKKRRSVPPAVMSESSESESNESSDVEQEHVLKLW